MTQEATEVQALRERLEVLEKRNPRTRLTILAAAACAAAALVMISLPSWADTDRVVVTARQFRLVDSAGRIRGEFHTMSNDMPMLTLSDGRGIRIILGVMKEGPVFLAMHDEKLNERVNMLVTPDKAAIEVLDNKENVIWRACEPEGASSNK